MVRVPIRCPRCGGQEVYATRQQTLRVRVCRDGSGLVRADEDVHADSGDVTFDAADGAAEGYAPGDVLLSCGGCGHAWGEPMAAEPASFGVVRLELRDDRAMDRVCAALQGPRADRLREVARGYLSPHGRLTLEVDLDSGDCRLVRRG